MRRPLILCFILALISLPVMGKSRVEGLKITKIDDQTARLSINLSSSTDARPEVSVRDNIIQVVLPNTIVWPKIEKRAKVHQKADTTLMAYQFDKNNVRVRTILPFETVGLKSQIQTTLRDGKLEMDFPITSKKIITKAVSKNITEEKVDNAKYDESYLDKLLQDKKETQKVVKAKKVVEVQKTAPTKSLFDTEPAKDEVKMTQSSPTKDSRSVFSLGSYIGKFVAFLGVVLLLFYGAVNFFRKGVLKKGKINFLNGSGSVSVVGTTYVGPKKSLLLVKVHNQMLLLGSSENGIQFLTEVDDVPGTIKEEEQSITGSNFDTTLDGAEIQSREFKIKEDINTSQTRASVGGLENFLGTSQKNNMVADKVKLSDKIKTKVKELKPLQ